MEDAIRRHFNAIIEDARAVLEDVEIEQDYSVKRALLKINGDFKNDFVLIGFDNAPDIKALKIKYGENYVQHHDERIPHFHGRGKESIELTKEISTKEFLETVKSFKND